MASSNNKPSFSEDEDQEEEFEHFDDFTLASSWERFISEIEAVCRQWLADGPKNLLEKNAVCLGISKNLYMVKYELKYLMKSYCMEYYFESTNDGSVAHWNFNLHDLQLSFGVKEFLVIAPQSASGVVLDAPEASKLLSAVAIALSNSSSLWPAFVPVHDPSRKAYIGIQNMGTVFTRRFESDRIGSQVPIKLMHLEGLYELFISKFVFSTLDLSMNLFKVNFTMKLTYKTIPYDDDDEVERADAEIIDSSDSGVDTHSKTQWDEDCPWSEWYSAEDPVKGFELITIWSVKTIESSLEMAELENASVHEAEKWIIFPIFSPNLPSLPGSGSTSQYVVSSAALKPEDPSRRGSAGVVGSMMLLNSCQYMHAPFTQDAPIMTEDMHEERLQAAEAFGDSFSFSAQLERDILSSDMSAFKAANPYAVFEDFIRWHSPKDWENDDIQESGGSQSDATDKLKTKWPPRGRLSERMSDYANSWRKIWNDEPALPVSSQRPLLDPYREGEKVLHYLETLRPHQLLEQMVCTAFRAAADTLNKSSFGGLKNMTTKMGQLYLIMASMLKPLQANLISADSEFTEDSRRLCVTFEHVEKLLTVAASLHRKFVQAPRLSEAIFNDFFNFYLPKMGTGTVGADNNKGFEKKQEVRIREREIVANMFPPPTANQSWRKVLSMGNLLNGHEPILREIIFSVRDRMSGSYYAAATTPWGNQQEIETYRMYICGSSNDLQVALSVASCD